MLMTEVRGERPNRFRQKATASQLTTYHDQRYEVWWILTYAATFRWSGISIMDPSINSSDCWWFNGVQDIFLARFRPSKPVKLCLKTTANLTMAAHHVHPLWTHSTYLLISTSSRITHYVTIVSNYPFEQWLHCTQMAWTVTWSQSNRAPLDVMEREVHIMDVQQTTLHQLYDAVMPQTVKVVNLKLNLKGILNKVSN